MIFYFISTILFWSQVAGICFWSNISRKYIKLKSSLWLMLDYYHQIIIARYYYSLWAFVHLSPHTRSECLLCSFLIPPESHSNLYLFTNCRISFLSSFTHVSNLAVPFLYLQTKTLGHSWFCSSCCRRLRWCSTAILSHIDRSRLAPLVVYKVMMVLSNHNNTPTQ